MYQVDAIPAFNDNYIWAINGNNKLTAIVDPGDGKVVLDYLHHHHRELTDILITHHHADHIGGVSALVKAFPNCRVYGPNSERFKSFAKGKNEADRITILNETQTLEVVELPGHTRDHIGFFDQANVFVGDTLFAAGCGRLFEGSPEQMLHSLEKLSALSDDTKVYCAHEYTAANIEFALTVDTQNEDLTIYQKWVIERRRDQLATIPTTIGQQKKVNPFLRCHDDKVQTAVQQQSTIEVIDKVSCFKAMRQLKDDF